MTDIEFRALGDVLADRLRQQDAHARAGVDVVAELAKRLGTGIAEVRTLANRIPEMPAVTFNPTINVPPVEIPPAPPFPDFPAFPALPEPVAPVVNVHIDMRGVVDAINGLTAALAKQQPDRPKRAFEMHEDQDGKITFTEK